MDIEVYLQRFESSMTTFSGGDPLEQWDKFVELLLRKFPDSTSQLSLVLNRLVDTFSNVEKYANDPRYVNYCIKYASSCADPIAWYNHIFSKGVGTLHAVLYVSWAHQLEQRCMHDQAEAVYQKGLECKAQPAADLLLEYRQFQTRTRNPPAASGGRDPLQSSHSANIMTTRGEPPVQIKEPADCQPTKPPERKRVVMISRSEYSGKLPPSSNENLVPAYDKEALQCEGSELCFEEVRAQRYFQKMQEQQQETIVFEEDQTQTHLNALMRLKMTFEDLDESCHLGAAAPRPVPNPCPPAGQPHPLLCSNRTTHGPRLPSEPACFKYTPLSDGPAPSMGSRASAPIPSQLAPFPHVSHNALDLSPQTPVLTTSMSSHVSVPVLSASHHPAVSTSRNSSLPAMSMPHNAHVPAMSMPHHATSMPYNAPVHASSMSHNALFPAAFMSHHASVPAPAMSYDAPVPAASMSHHISALAMSMSHRASVPAPAMSYDAPVPAASMSHHASVPAPAMSYDAPVPAASMSHHASVPAMSMSHHASVPAPAMSYDAPVPAASMSHHASVPAMSMSHHASVPALAMSYDAPVPAASMSHHASVPAMSMSHHASVPAPAMSYDAPVPAASMSHYVSVPAMSASHHATSMLCDAHVPAASMSHHKSVLLHGAAPENDRTENEDPLEPEHGADMSQGGTANLSHITPNDSLGYIQATPSRVLPSPTVNTREALGVIMDMFQAPTLLEDPFPSALEDMHRDVIYTRNGPAVKPAAVAPFTIFQDEAETENKENCSAPATVRDKVKPTRGLAELPKSTKANDSPTELTPDESMWLNTQGSLVACPNSTSDFAMLARFVSTPMSTASSFFPDEESNEEGVEDVFARRCTKKLSPIMEQSPSEEKPDDAGVTRQAQGSQQGTIVGEGLAMNTQFMTTSCTTMVQPPPPAVLSFRDQTLGPHSASLHKSAGPGWEVYTSPEPTPKREPFTIMEDMDEAQPVPELKTLQDIPMSPESAPQPDWLVIQTPEKSAIQDLNAFLSPDRAVAPSMSHLCQDVPMSPQVDFSADAHMTSPEKGKAGRLDISMNPNTPGRSCAHPAMSLVPDPWDDDLIAHLLSSMDPPLTAHTHCVMWNRNLPNIAPKMTLSMDNASLQVDGVLGEGAFAKVYQASDPTTSDKMVLKVQKPANPWEFYINTQLDARVPPSTRHLYSSFRSVHIFNNGSVLLGEMHNYGTLLNAVNMYRTLGSKVMPQPLVMHFAVCILHMIEQLHSVGIVHADVKPDNFLFGEKFLESKSFDGDYLDHGLVLIDLGQSIDMRLFPEGTAFTAKCLTSGFQCTEMQVGKPWNYQTDYFGVAGTVYCMLFGTYMQVVNDGGVWRTNGVFRRNPHSDLWQSFFHALLNVPDCRSPPDLRGLRLQLLSVLETRYRTKLPALKSRLVVLLLESGRKALRR